MARVNPVTPGSRPELAALEAQIAAERGRISPLYQVLLNSQPIATGWEAMLTAVRNKSSLPADLREIVILRVAVLNRAPYEFDAHIPHAQKAGVADAKIAALRDTQPAGLAPLEQLAVELTDVMTREVQVSDALMQRVKAAFDDTRVVELVATIAAYNMVSRFLEALEIGH